MYDENHRLTRAGAEQAIKEGGTALIDGKLYGNIDTLPPASVFAKGNIDAEKAEKLRLKQQIALAQLQLDSLEEKPAAITPPKSDPKK